MGLFGFLSRGARLAGLEGRKRKLIRRLASARPSKQATGSGQAVGSLQQESAGDLYGLPEATIVTLVEGYVLYTSQGNHPSDVLSQMAERRCAITNKGYQTHFASLGDYVAYRLEVEHDGMLPRYQEHVNWCVQQALDHFRQEWEALNGRNSPAHSEVQPKEASGSMEKPKLSSFLDTTCLGVCELIEEVRGTAEQDHKELVSDYQQLLNIYPMTQFSFFYVTARLFADTYRDLGSIIDANPDSRITKDQADRTIRMLSTVQRNAKMFADESSEDFSAFELAMVEAAAEHMKRYRPAAVLFTHGELVLSASRRLIDWSVKNDI